MNKRGQVDFIVLAFINTVIFILVSPFLNDVISLMLPGMGAATAFFVKLLLWVVLLVLIMGGMRGWNNMGDIFGN